MERSIDLNPIVLYGLVMEQKDRGKMNSFLVIILDLVLAVWGFTKFMENRDFNPEPLQRLLPIIIIAD